MRAGSTITRARVYETFLNDFPALGSVCSAGRYGSLAEHYTRSKLPGVGISIGATRLFFQLKEAGIIQTDRSISQVLVTQLDPSLGRDYLGIAATLRSAGINTEVHLEGGKFAKQLKYADRAGIRFAVLMGSDEHARGAVMVKDLQQGKQHEVPRNELVGKLQELLMEGGG